MKTQWYARGLLIGGLGLVFALPLPAAELSGETAAAGLKDALQVGTGRAVDLLGRLDGYLGNPDVRIPIPDKLEKVGKTVRKLGLDDLVDEFETSMNRAAEAAAPLAKDVFVETIKGMSFSDALAIVRGEGHEATDYLRENAGPKLGEQFLPIVQEQLGAVGATQAFDRLMQRYSEIPFVSKPAVDLDAYVTEEALDGLFLMIAKEEEKIRKDPLARTTDLLKQVFGAVVDKDKKVPWWKKLGK